MKISQVYLALTAACALNAAGDEGSLPQLSDDERAAILAVLVEQYPEVASSPGIKAAFYNPAKPWSACEESVSEVTSNGGVATIVHKPGKLKCSRDLAFVYLLPHAERLGRKDALTATCERAVGHQADSVTTPSKWRCNNARFRQYVQLEKQICEVRLTGNTSTAALSAARSAGIQAITDFGQPAPEALVLFTQEHADYAWGRFGTDTCVGGLVVEFTRVSDGDPRVSTDWNATVSPNNEISRNSVEAQAGR